MMKTSPSYAELLKLDRTQPTPLYRQIRERFRAAIEQGLLQPGERLASARSLAGELGVARGTVELAYAELAGEGYLQARGQAARPVEAGPVRPRRLLWRGRIRHDPFRLVQRTR